MQTKEGGSASFSHTELLNLSEATKGRYREFSARPKSQCRQEKGDAMKSWGIAVPKKKATASLRKFSEDEDGTETTRPICACPRVFAAFSHDANAKSCNFCGRGNVFITSESVTGVPAEQKKQIGNRGNMNSKKRAVVDSETMLVFVTKYQIVRIGFNVIG